MCKISIIMPVYNGEKYLKEAIDSILDQTFKEFEFIIINDYSNDDSLKIINSYNDKRIILVNNDQNLGIAKSLNKGIEISKGKYIARMDADDICYRHRLETQINFMENNLDIGMCGSAVEVFTDNSSNIHECPLNHNEIKALQIFNSAFCHPTVMIRKEILSRHKLSYNEFYEGMEDYELWIRMSRVTKLANIKESLLKYRCHDGQVTKNISKLQHEKMKLIRKRTLKELSLEFKDEDVETLLMYATTEIFKYEDKIYKVFNLFERIIESNLESKIYDEKALRYVISYNIYWALLKYKNEYGKKIEYKSYKWLMSPITRLKALIKIG